MIPQLIPVRRADRPFVVIGSGCSDTQAYRLLGQPSPPPSPSPQSVSQPSGTPRRRPIQGRWVMGAAVLVVAALLLVWRAMGDEENGAARTATPSPEPILMDMLAISFDESSQEIVFEFVVSDPSRIGSFKLLLLNKNNLLVLEHDHTPPPYDLIRIPAASVPAGEYSFLLRAYDPSDELVAEYRSSEPYALPELAP